MFGILTVFPGFHPNWGLRGTRRACGVEHLLMKGFQAAARWLPNAWGRHDTGPVLCMGVAAKSQLLKSPTSRTLSALGASQKNWTRCRVRFAE